MLMSKLHGTLMPHDVDADGEVHFDDGVDLEVACDLMVMMLIMMLSLLDREQGDISLAGGGGRNVKSCTRSLPVAECW